MRKIKKMGKPLSRQTKKERQKAQITKIPRKTHTTETNSRKNIEIDLKQVLKN